MTPKLEEARLREVARTLRTRKERGSAFPLYWGSDIIAANNANADAIDALLDALSAERERGDRAVEALKPFADASQTVVKRGGEVVRMDDGDIFSAGPIKWGHLRRAFLATQKAEGA